jgi:hypothetical protein
LVTLLRMSLASGIGICARMRKVLRRYGVEITLALLGLVAALLESLIADRPDIALLVALTSFLLAFAVAALRMEISDLSAEKQILASIPEPAWRKDAQNEIDQARAKFTRWASGVRSVPERSSLNWQISSLKRARTSIQAIHLAMDISTLDMWINSQRGFARMVEAYRHLPEGIDHRRIITLNRDDPDVSEVIDGRRIIRSEAVAAFCDLQTRSRVHGGLQCELRIAWCSAQSRDVADMMVIDDREACTIESLGRGNFSDLEVYVSEPTIASFRTVFEDLWADAVPAAHFDGESGVAARPSL